MNPGHRGSEMLGRTARQSSHSFRRINSLPRPQSALAVLAVGKRQGEVRLRATQEARASFAHLWTLHTSANRGSSDANSTFAWVGCGSSGHARATSSMTRILEWDAPPHAVIWNRYAGDRCAVDPIGNGFEQPRIWAPPQNQEWRQPVTEPPPKISMPPLSASRTGSQSQRLGCSGSGPVVSE